jgi:hypothetical protein
MKANRQATIPMRIFIHYESETSDTHTQIFQGIRMGIIITLVVFWLPFSIIVYFWGWLFILAYGAFLLAIFIVLGLISRHYDLLQSIVRSKPSAKTIGS